ELLGGDDLQVRGLSRGVELALFLRVELGAGRDALLLDVGPRPGACLVGDRDRVGASLLDAGARLVVLLLDGRLGLLGGTAGRALVLGQAASRSGGSLVRLLAEAVGVAFRGLRGRLCRGLGAPVGEAAFPEAVGLVDPAAAVGARERGATAARLLRPRPPD